MVNSGVIGPKFLHARVFAEETDYLGSLGAAAGSSGGGAQGTDFQPQGSTHDWGEQTFRGGGPRPRPRLCPHESGGTAAQHYPDLQGNHAQRLRLPPAAGPVASQAAQAACTRDCPQAAGRGLPVDEECT